MSEKHDITNGMESGPCVVCGRAESRACARCRHDFYCGKQHQLQDWPRHKLGCGGVEVQTDPASGCKYLVATKDISGGSVIFKESPVVTFPTSWNVPLADNVMFSMCVGCGMELAVAASLPAQCGCCGWPVCNAMCAQRQEHRAECAAFRRANFKLRFDDAMALGQVRLHALTALRLCLAMQEPEVGRRLRELPNSLPNLKDALSNGGVYGDSLREAHAEPEGRCDRALAWLRDVARVTWLPAEELRRGLACALIHGFEGTSGEETHLVGGVFPALSLLGHSCLPNCSRYAVKRGSTAMQLVAGRDVRRGERLCTTSLRDPLHPKWGCDTHRRRRFLASYLGFVCRCDLCEDPTRAGLHLDAAPDGAVAMEREFERLLSKAAPLDQWEEFIRRAVAPSGPLSPTHHLVLRAKRQILCPDKDGVEGEILNCKLRIPHSLGDAERVSKHGRDLLKATGVLRPGVNHQRADVLRQLVVLDVLRIAQFAKSLRPRQWPSRRAEWKVIIGEAAEVLRDLKICSVSPFEQEIFQGVVSQVTMVTSSLPPNLTRDADILKMVI